MNIAVPSLPGGDVDSTITWKEGTSTEGGPLWQIKQIKQQNRYLLALGTCGASRYELANTSHGQSTVP